MVVSQLDLRDFRSYERQELELAPGLTLAVGPNGSGKTNLLEAVHLGSQGFSFRTRRDAAVVRFGAAAAAVSLAGSVAGRAPFSTAVTVQRDGAKGLRLNGSPVSGQDALRQVLPVLTFTPDRLAIVKGPPAIRRAYLDRVVGRLSPARAAAAVDYAAALLQRNAALRRARAGLSSRESLGAWTVPLVRLATDLDAARLAAVEEVGRFFGSEAERLGLGSATLAYRPSGVSEEELDARLGRDIERGMTGVGPHVQDLRIEGAGLDLRAYGSQGQQRLAVLSLLLAEALAIADARSEPALLLLDDVLSELDDRRRARLLEAVPPGWQMLITATTDRALPSCARPPDQVLDVVPGRATPR